MASNEATKSETRIEIKLCYLIVCPLKTVGQIYFTFKNTSPEQAKKLRVASEYI